MYRQISVHPDDWDFQRILWTEKGQTETYHLTTVTYGLGCAPFLALRALLQLIHDEGHNYPEAVSILTHDRYVDDIFGGSDSLENAKEKVIQVNKLCMAGGFPLKKWVSNESEILSTIPEEDRNSKGTLQFEDETVRALGLFWNHQMDYLFFNFVFSPPKYATKRTVLSKIAQFFDPLGLLSPIFIKLKIFMQELWAVKLSWDDKLPSTQSDTWGKLQLVLEGLETIHIPRWIRFRSNSNIEIHGFCDASQLAMAAAVYLRSSCENVITSHLLCSKTKVAPLKRMTIPRLELSAAVILTKLIKHCLDVLNYPHVSCHLWTDSQAVHTWILNHPSRWKEFVHNRVCVIQETLPAAQWHHIDGKHNPADCATRGLSAKALQNFSLWWVGPEWLIRECTEWPLKESLPPADVNLEERPLQSHHITKEQPWDLLVRYSSWSKLLRITALCKRISSLLLKRSVPKLKSPLTRDELNLARNFLISQIQSQHFHKDFQNLTKGNEVDRTSSLRRLCPFIDQQGLLRVGGRLRNSSLSETAKHPYILPRHSHISTLLIQNSHLKTLHGSTRDTLAYLRQQFWIIGGRAPVKSFIIKCVTCIRNRRAHAQSLMGQLPVSRVTPSRPFLNSGVDYAGPFMLKTWQGKSRLYKAWIAVFVCFSTSAIHLEIVSDYTTDAFIASYKRFISRRGICATLTSDCGTNFKGADRDLRKLFSQDSVFLGQIASLIASDGTKWIFNPPAAPHFGGKFEAAVKSMKYHLKRLIGDKNLTYEQLSTILAQIEAILNSRPLCALTDDPDDLSVLTPGHFLIGHALYLIPEPNLEQISTSRLSKWQHLTQLIQSFWSKWSKEYLQRHQAMYKWNRNAQPLAKGDLVLIIDERYPPCKWPLGRIVEVHPGPDNIVRVVSVKTSTSTFTRPIVKLSPLYISSSLDTSLPRAAKVGGDV